MRHIKQRTSELPEEIRDLVAMYVHQTKITIQRLNDQNIGQNKTRNESNKLMKFVFLFLLFAGFVFAAFGILLVWISDDEAQSQISAFGLSVDTDSAGIAAIAIGASIAIYSGKRAFDYLERQ